VDQWNSLFLYHPAFPKDNPEDGGEIFLRNIIIILGNIALFEP
jgi:hypothetical protein